jgi:hypothetical protein
MNPRQRFKQWWSALPSDTRRVLGWLTVLLGGAILLSVVSIGRENPMASSPPAIDTTALRNPSGQPQFTAWLLVAAVWAIELMSKSTFWICICILWGASIVSSAITSAVSTISYQLEALQDRVKRPSDDDDDFEP